MLKCDVCGFDKEDEFVGIFATGVTFKTTDKTTCGLFGCPKCNTVKFVTDMDYINKRKEAYKNSRKEEVYKNLLKKED